MIGIDSNSIIDIFRDNPDLKLLFEKLDDELCSTIINYQEIIFGINLKNEKDYEEEKYYDKLFDSMILYNLDIKSCKKAREILFELKKSGKTIGEFDCMIAGIFLANGVNKIITRNKKHFESIPGFEVISY
jgi:tRNA(fMet)-specific endonuclease VapC